LKTIVGYLSKLVASISVQTETTIVVKLWDILTSMHLSDTHPL
jgi:hypothetical protein